MSRRLVMALAAVAVLAVSTTAVAATGKQITISGGVKFDPQKQQITDTQHFSSADSIRAGKVKIVNRTKTGDPHTLSLVKKSQLPRKGNAFPKCSACDAFFGAHQFPEDGPPAQPLVDVGKAGFSEPGDSIVMAPGKGATIDVTAAKGTTLYYICIFHPWMQGKFKVR